MDTAYELATCPVCDSPDDDEVASREAVARELEELWEFHIRRLRPGTPPRFLMDRVVFSQDPPIRLSRCRECGSIYRNPRERARDLVDLYAGEALDAGVLQGLFEAQKRSYGRQARRLTRLVGRAGRALEIGSYVGAFQEAARERGWAVDGVDVNPAAVAFAREAGFRVFQGQIGDTPLEQAYDAVVIWNCFDQLPNPREVVRAARDRLRPGGHIAIRVPSGEFYQRYRRRLRGPGAPFARAALAHNNLLGFPYRTGYTAASLGRLLRDVGFDSLRVVGDTLVPIADRWTLPWARLEERLTKQLLVRLERGERAAWLEVYARAPSTG